MIILKKPQKTNEGVINMFWTSDKSREIDFKIKEVKIMLWTDLLALLDDD